MLLVERMGHVIKDNDFKSIKLIELILKGHTDDRNAWRGLGGISCKHELKGGYKFQRSVFIELRSASQPRHIKFSERCLNQPAN